MVGTHIGEDIVFSLLKGKAWKHEQGVAPYAKNKDIGQLAGTPLIRMKQRHAVGTSNFILDDNIIYVIAGSAQPIKRVTEGDVTMLLGTPTDNADLSQEFLMLKRTGLGVVMDREYGAYKFS